MRKLALLCCLSVCAARQNDAPVFRSQAPIVLFPIAVYDKAGQPVQTLSESDISVLDNGRPKPAHVDLIGSYRTKIALVIVVQTSAISQPALLKIQKTGSLIEGYITGETGEAAVVAVNDDVHVLQPFTEDGSLIRDTFRHLKPSGAEREAHTLDGVEEALRLLSQRPPEDRRLIVVISETRDRGSRTPFSQVLLDTQQSGASIYTLSYSAYLTPFTTKASEYVPAESGGLLLIATELARLAKRNIAEALASTSGGRHLSFATVKALENDLVEVGKEVHHQYLLSLTPDADPQPAYHAVTIAIKDYPKATIRTRPGYWSVPLNQARSQ
jgi:VWFA-related protein